MTLISLLKKVTEQFSDSDKPIEKVTKQFSESDKPIEKVINISGTLISPLKRWFLLVKRDNSMCN